MNSMLSIGASGLQAAHASLDRSATRVARWGTTDAAAAPAGLTAEAVAQIEARHRFAANLQTVKTADALLGTLIDTFA
jgi:flagellar hook protein FlgE